MNYAQFKKKAVKKYQWRISGRKNSKQLLFSYSLFFLLFRNSASNFRQMQQFLGCGASRRLLKKHLLCTGSCCGKGAVGIQTQGQVPRSEQFPHQEEEELGLVPGYRWL